ncbi:MAG: hypothetical protein ACRD0U_12670 [Acidimicrobiales bacterium]
MNDFDFLEGAWNIANCRLRKLLVGSTDWDEFPAHSLGTRHFDGAASVTEITFPTQGFSGLGLRVLDPERQEWSIYWVNSTTGTLYPPVVGRLVDGAGEFYGDDTHEGTPIRARYIWSDIALNSAHWEQAFSADGGQTWETNWVMEWTRA